MIKHENFVIFSFVFKLETRLANERSTKSFAEKLEADSLMLNQSIRDESVKR